MRRGPDGTTWRTSFPHRPDIIDVTHSVLTVMSGSRGTGGHASFFLEHIKTTGPAHRPETLLIDLTTGGRGSVRINQSAAQRLMGQALVDFDSWPRKDLAGLADSHHHSYSLNIAAKTRFLAAVARFRTKVGQGRYKYRVAGGALGWISTRPGQRGINCADFIIKVLKEAGVANIPYRLFDTPKRVAT